MEREWQWFSISFEDNSYSSFWFFPIFQSVIRQHAIYPKENITINRNNDYYQYKFVFDWQDENTCGIEVYRKVS